MRGRPRSSRLGFPRHRASLALLDPSSAFLLQYGLGRRAMELAGIFLGAFGILLVGWLDDKHELRPRAKFAGQFLIAALVAASGARITLFVPSLVFSYAVTILWILTVINAFNFMDNMNGLCAGLGAIGAYHFAIIAAADSQYLVALIAFLTFGALLGFLPYNFPRARAFLGDAGSHLVGYLLAVLAILPHFYTVRHPRRWAVLIPLLVLAIPLVDLVWVVLLRWRIGQPFYQGDTNHLSHRLVRRGLTRYAGRAGHLGSPRKPWRSWPTSAEPIGTWHRPPTVYASALLLAAIASENIPSTSARGSAPTSRFSLSVFTTGILRCSLASTTGSTSSNR